MAQGFRNRLPTNVTPVASRDPAAFKSGFAEGLQELGGAITGAAEQQAQLSKQVQASEYRIQQEAQRRQRSATIADRAGAWAETQVGLEDELQKLKDESAPGAPDHATKAGELITSRLKGFLDTLPNDPEVRERFAPLVAHFGATTRRDENTWAVKTRTKYEGQRIGTWSDTTGNGLVTTPTPEKLQGAFEATDLLIGALDLPGTEKAKLAEDTKRGFSRNFLDGRLAAGDWRGTRALLDAGKFDTLLDPDQKVQYLQRTENAEKIATREAELAQSRIRDEARDAVNAVEAKVAAGIVPDAAELRAVRATAKAAGLDAAEIVKLDALDVRVTVNRSYAPLVGQPGGAERIRRDRDTLTAKIATGKASESDQVMKAQLDALVDKADTKEISGLRELVTKGPVGQLQAMALLSGSAQARYEKAEKLKPGLGGVALLPPVTRSLAVQGEALREGRKDEFGKEAEVRAQLNKMLGPVANEVGQYSTLLKTTWDIMASNRVSHGGTGIDPADLRDAARMATGGQIHPDGKWRGGLGTVRGFPVLLPDWMSDADFDQALSRQSFANAVYRNGVPATKEDILSRYRPSYFAEDTHGNVLYHFIDPTGSLLADKGGSAMVLKVKR